MAKIVIIKECTLLSEKDFNELIELVSIERKRKIIRYKRYSDKCRSLIAALLYRCLICRDYNMKNSMLRFEIEDLGKIICTNEDINAKFNVSHSGCYVTGIIDKKEVGIDVEKIGTYDNKVAERFFDNREYEVIESSENKPDVFFRIWTLKEAYVKYLGMGMYKDFDSFRIEFADENNSNIYDNGYEKKVHAISHRLDNNYFVSSISTSKIEHEIWNLNQFVENVKKWCDN